MAGTLLLQTHTNHLGRTIVPPPKHGQAGPPDVADKSTRSPTILQFLRITAGLAGLVLLLSAPLAAQATPPPAMPDSVQALLSEFQQLQAHLQQTQMEAIQADSALEAEQQALQERVEEAIVEMDPALGAKIDSLPGLQQAAMAAQQSGDTTEIRNLMATGQRIQASIQQAQQQVVQQEEVAQEIEVFQEQLLTAMEEVDPEIRTVVERLDELTERLGAIQRGGGLG